MSSAPRRTVLVDLGNGPGFGWGLLFACRLLRAPSPAAPISLPRLVASELDMDGSPVCLPVESN
jgi:hypothetical protein